MADARLIANGPFRKPSAISHSRCFRAAFLPGLVLGTVVVIGLARFWGLLHFLALGTSSNLTLLARQQEHFPGQIHLTRVRASLHLTNLLFRNQADNRTVRTALSLPPFSSRPSLSLRLSLSGALAIRHIASASNSDRLSSFAPSATTHGRPFQPARLAG